MWIVGGDLGRETIGPLEEWRDVWSLVGFYVSLGAGVSSFCNYPLGLTLLMLLD